MATGSIDELTISAHAHFGNRAVHTGKQRKLKLYLGLSFLADTSTKDPVRLLVVLASVAREAKTAG